MNETYCTRVHKYQIRMIYNGVQALVNICNRKRHQALIEHDEKTFVTARTIRSELILIEGFLHWLLERMEDEKEYEIEIH